MAGFVCLMPAALIVGLSLGVLGAWPAYRHSGRAWLLVLGACIGLVGQVAGIAALVVLTEGWAEEYGLGSVAIVALGLVLVGSYLPAVLATYPLGRLLGQRASDLPVHYDTEPPLDKA
jgi:hypothetical protein